MILEMFILTISLFLSFFFAGAETAFVSVNKVRVEVWRRRKKKVAEIILPFLENPERFLYTTLIGNNIFNIAFASYATLYLNQYFSAEVTVVLIVFIILLVGEILPKTVFLSLADGVIGLIARPLQWMHYLFLPLIFVISKISEMILAIFGYQKEELRLFFSKKDIEILLKESQEIYQQSTSVEGEFLSGIFNLKELWVRDAMVPRTEMIATPKSTTIEDMYKIFEKYGHTKIPVYQKALDEIIGVVFLKELFLEPDNFEQMIRDVIFVPETKKCSELLSELRQKNASIAIVIDEYGGTAGLITTEDLVEELFGEIQDEHDEQTIMIRKFDEKTYRVNARMEIDKLNEKIGINLPDGEYETLSGFILTQIGRIPRRDEIIEFQQIRITVSSATRRKIHWVKIVLP